MESGHDLKLVCKELSRVVRDMMVLSVDPTRAGDGELADDERERLVELAARFSREDLLRAFDLLAKAEQEIRNASQPRYHFEMVLLRWMHLRKLVPLTELMEQLGTGRAASVSRTVAPSAPRTVGHTVTPSSPRALAPLSGRTVAPSLLRTTAPSAPSPSAPASAPVSGSLKDALLAEIRRGKQTLYELAVAQARRIDVGEDLITFTFPPNQTVPRMQLEQNRGWIEDAAQRLAGRRIAIAIVQAEPSDSTLQEGSRAAKEVPATAKSAAAPKRDLKAEAMSLVRRPGDTRRLSSGNPGCRRDVGRPKAKAL